MPLILGFVVIGLLTTAAAVVAGQAFVQQRGLQAVCDGAAAAGAATAVDLRRDVPLDGFVHFGDVGAAVRAYLARDPERRDVRVTAEVSPAGRTLSLTCTELVPIAFGRVFDRPHGVRHVVRSSAQAPLAGGQ